MSQDKFGDPLSCKQQQAISSLARWRECRREQTLKTSQPPGEFPRRSRSTQKKKSQIRLNLRLLAEMVGFEPTCPIKDKMISSL